MTDRVCISLLSIRYPLLESCCGKPPSLTVLVGQLSKSGSPSLLAKGKEQDSSCSNGALPLESQPASQNLNNSTPKQKHPESSAHQLPPPRSPETPFFPQIWFKSFSFDPISHLPPHPILLKALRQAAPSLSAPSTHQPLNSSQSGG